MRLQAEQGTASFRIVGNTDSVTYSAILRKDSDGKSRYIVDMFSSADIPDAACSRHDEAGRAVDVFHV